MLSFIHFLPLTDLFEQHFIIEQVYSISLAQFKRLISLFEVGFMELVAIIEFVGGFEEVAIFGNESLIIDLDFIFPPNLLLEKIDSFGGFDEVGVPTFSKAKFD